MYQGIKSNVSHGGEQSTFFRSFRGEKLSPVLFALFLNDLETFLEENMCIGINLEISTGNISTYINLFILLYADDTVNFWTEEVSFLYNLNVFYEYFDKTMIMIFGTRNDEKYNFKLGENSISICKEFKYLCVVFSKNRSFYKARKHNVDREKKAMHLLYTRIHNLNLPLDLKLHLIIPSYP